MSNGRSSRFIKRVRCEVLVALKMLYPAPLQAEQLYRSLIALFPTLEWSAFQRDLIYLVEKGYLLHVASEFDRGERITPWRKRWFRLTSTGLEIADHLVKDPALDIES